MNFARDSVYVSNAPLRCWLGWHHWRYFSMALTFHQAFPDSPQINRRCQKCGFIQCYEENRGTWRGRI